MLINFEKRQKQGLTLLSKIGLKSSHFLNIMFAEKEGVDYAKLIKTPEGEYSMTRRPDGKKIIQRMELILGTISDKHITDLTGNVGGDTILFALNYKEVCSIEIKEDNFLALKNNVQQYGLTNVTLHHGDSTTIYDWYTDVIYIDPPWGGPEYKDKENLDLFLGDIRIDIFVKDIMKKDWRPQHIFLKLPRNYNFARLDSLDIKKFSIRGFYLIYVAVFE